MNNYIDTDNSVKLANNIKIHCSMLKKVLTDKLISDKNLIFYVTKLIELGETTSNYLLDVSDKKNITTSQVLKSSSDSPIKKIVKIVNFLKEDYNSIGQFGTVWKGDYAYTTKDVFEEIVAYINLCIQ